MDALARLRDAPESAAILLDVDGTLAPIVERPEDAAVPGVFDVEYTRDGSYLRLKKYTAGYLEIELPDGSVRRFDALGMPTLIKDAFGNSLTIDYTTAGQWVLTDSQNRTQRIYFRYDLPSYSQGAIDHIDLKAFSAFGGGFSGRSAHRSGFRDEKAASSCAAFLESRGGI